MYSDFYTTPAATLPTANVDSTWVVISAVLAIVGGIIGYALFVSKKDEGEYAGFVAWLHNFLNFKKYFIEVILKAMYLISALFITLSSFSLIGTSVAGFFLYLILGNILVRISYELILMMLTIVNNTTEINQKLSVQKKEPEKVTSTKGRKKVDKKDE